MWRLTVYCSQLSPFCSVLDSYLGFERIPHTRVEVEPWKKRQLDEAFPDAPVEKRLLPAAVVSWPRNDDGGAVDDETLNKVETIIDRMQELLGPRGRLPRFSAAQKNTCMRINEEVLPVLALNRHLTLSASRETVAYMREFAQQWGTTRFMLSHTLVPVFYWRTWRKMGNAVLKDAGFDSPEQALVGVLERWQEKRDGTFFGGTAPSMVDVWLFGHVRVCQRESLFDKLVAERCPATMEWFKAMEMRMLRQQ